MAIPLPVKARMKALGLSAVNTPKKTPSHPTKSHVVMSFSNGKYKVVRFGQQNVSGSPAKKGESMADKARRKSFKARHAENIAKGKMSAAFWSNRVKWIFVLPIISSFFLGVEF
jgi:hypothetical protein